MSFSIREPLLKPVPIGDLRPTQITVGYREVAEKRRVWRERLAAAPDGEKAAEYLGSHMIPVILGPKDRHYILDHHHLCRALHEEGVGHILVNVIDDLSSLSKRSFWVYLDNRGWCHPYDARGERQAFADIPQAVTKMTDDPYRSLAGELRRAGGFAKDTTPFSEFIWADFLRGRIKAKLIDEDFAAALKKALVLAKSKAGSYLPGWAGPTS
ncbi:MAG TPA: ParB-like protein [Caulobacteraceae bacterium]|nr:ParB-like protein [Caulobacteraceae bacterium]